MGPEPISWPSALSLARRAGAIRSRIFMFGISGKGTLEERDEAEAEVKSAELTSTEAGEGGEEEGRNLLVTYEDIECLWT